jgi:hypothetical protein
MTHKGKRMAFFLVPLTKSALSGIARPWRINRLHPKEVFAYHDEALEMLRDNATPHRVYRLGTDTLPTDIADIRCQVLYAPEEIYGYRSARDGGILYAAIIEYLAPDEW